MYEIIDYNSMRFKDNNGNVDIIAIPRDVDFEYIRIAYRMKEVYKVIGNLNDYPCSHNIECLTNLLNMEDEYIFVDSEDCDEYYEIKDGKFYQETAKSIVDIIKEKI